MTRRLAILAALAAALVPASSLAQGGFDVSVRETEAWPDREVVVSLPAKRALDSSQVSLLENGRPVVDLVVKSAAEDVGRGLILAIDASESMRGEAIEGAMVAARSFAKRRDRDTPMGVIFFSREPGVALAPTTDQKKIDAVLAAPPPLSRGTQIFDAGSRSISVLKRSDLTSGAVLIFSDGQDVGSGTTPAALGRSARRNGVQVYSVGLRSRAFDDSSLRALAAASRGRYAEAGRARDLPPLFAAIGERLSSQQVIGYRSVAAVGSNVAVEVRVEGVPGVAKTSYRAPQLGAAQTAPRQPPAESSGLGSLAIALLAIAGFLVVTLVIYLLISPKRKSVVSRVYDFAGGSDVAAAALIEPERKERRRRRGESGRWVRYAEAVELSGLALSPAALAFWTLAGTFAVAWYMIAVAEQVPLALFAVAVPLGVRTLVLSRIKARRQAFEEQLPDNLQVLASALRAGYSFSAALAAMAEDAGEPARTELLRAVSDEQLGVGVEDALTNIGRRMGSPEIEYVGIVARMQLDSGGNTAEVLDRVIETIRARHQLKRLVRVLTAQGRLGGAMVSAMPLVAGLGLATLNPGYFDPMFESFTGVVLFIVAVLMLLVGWLAIRKIVDVEP